MDTSSLSTHDLLIVLDITRRLAEQRAVQPVMDYVSETIFEFIDAERCLIALFAADGSLDIQSARNRKGERIEDATDQVSFSILQRVRNTLSPLLINDALSDEYLRGSRSVFNLKLRSVMCVPLISYGHAIGVIYVENRSLRGRFHEENLLPLVLFSHQVVVTIENARFYESLEARIAERTHALEDANRQLTRQAMELRELGIRDSLTNLHNRRYFTDQLPVLFAAAQHDQQPLVLACADIDGFKQINDAFFHETGDRVLIALADLLRENIRTADCCARIGGEEFVIAMPNTTLPAAIQICERLCGLIEQHDWNSLATGLQVSTSFGLAVSTECADAPSLLRLADTRLYLAKRLGKNRVIAVEPSL
jgi:diguanylate cyclase (GGDEF)-like protein